MFEAKKTRVYMILLSETTCTLLAACAIPMVNPPRIVAEGAKWEEVSRDGLFTAEGVVAARDGMIYATAITRPEAIKQNNPGGTIYRYDPSTGVTTTSRSTQTRRLALSVRGHERKREMNQVVVLEWTFSPTHYFEQTIEVRQDEYILKIENGKAAARVASRAYDADPNYRLALHEALFAEPGHFKITGGSVDFLVKDKDGNVLADTRTDRIEKKQHFANLAEKYRDTDRVLCGLLNSYAAAVKDPDNELVHLYEVREAVAAKSAAKGPRGQP